MIYNLKKNLIKVSGISYEVNSIDLSFKEEILEENYRKSNLNDEIRKSKIFFIFIFIYFLLYFIFSYVFNLSILTTLLMSFGLAIETILAMVINYKKNYRVNRILNIVRFFSFYLSLTVIFALNSSLFSEENKFWFVNSLIIMINLVLTYFLDYNLVIFLLVPLLNSLLIVYLQYKSNLPVSLIAVDYVLKIALNIFILIFKKIDNSEKRKKFFEINKNNDNS